MKRLINMLVLSFENSKTGFSGRKLSAFAGVTSAIGITFFLLEKKDMLPALIVWLLFALLCMGIVTIANLIELKK